jgi:hypothetical protein
MNNDVRTFLSVAALAVAACGGHDSGPMMMTGPSSRAGQGYGSAFMSVTPAGGSTGVPTSASIVIRFGGGMAGTMEQYVDLHVGDLAGPTVPMGCAWSADRTVLTCTPSAALQPRTTYVLHLGGGMTTQSGEWIDYGPYGSVMGGQWIMGGMMERSHAGSPWA